MVVTSRHQKVTERVVSERPDVAVVGEVEGFFRGGVGEGPVEDGAFGTAGGEDVGVIGVPGEGCSNEGGISTSLLRKGWEEKGE